jgi:hypothetical protein
MKIIAAGVLAIVSGVLGACAQPQIFPPEATQDVAVTFDFNAWRQATSGNPNLKVQLGGRIVASEQTDQGLLIVGHQLPIVAHPAYGPVDTRKRNGEFEFAFLFKGQIESSMLMPGNRFIIVGTTQGKHETVMVDGAPKSEPYLVAMCVHIWKTEGREIADFPNVGAGYSPLEEQTYCEKKTGS